MSLGKIKKEVDKQAAKEFPPQDLSRAKLNIGSTIPSNCGSFMVREFQGGHSSSGHGPELPMDWRQWKHVLFQSGWQYKKGTKVVIFSEAKRQSKYTLSARALYDILMEQKGSTGSKICDRKYNYYMVKLTPTVWNEIIDKKNRATPPNCKPLIPNKWEALRFEPVFGPFDIELY